MAIDLDEKISYREIIGWRLHWIICKIDWDIIRPIKDLASFGHPTIERLQYFITEVEKHIDAADRVLWETATMEGQDNGEYDVKIALHDDPKFISFKEKIDEVIALLGSSYEVANNKITFDKFKHLHEMNGRIYR